MSSTAVRAVQLLLAFQRKRKLGTTAAANLLRCTPKQLRAARGHLLDAGVPVHAQGEGRERLWLLEEASVRELRVGVGDLAALYLGGLFFSFLHDTPFNEWHHQLQEKLGGDNPQMLKTWQDLRGHIFLKEEPYRRSDSTGEVVETLLSAVLNRWQVHATYKGEDVVLEPLALLVYRRALYTITADSKGQPRCYAVDRMTEASTSRQKFERPADFSMDPLLNDTFGIYGGDHAVQRVRVRFSPGVERLVRAREWHPEQRLHTEDSGHIVLSFRARGDELVRWVLEWGDKAEVLEPAWLRERVVAELRGALGLYGEPPSTSVAAPR